MHIIINEHIYTDAANVVVRLLTPSTGPTSIQVFFNDNDSLLITDATHVTSIDGLPVSLSMAALEAALRIATEFTFYNNASSTTTPGGSPSTVQYNNAGAFGGVSNVISNGIDLFRDADSSPFLLDFDTRAAAADTPARLDVIKRSTTKNISKVWSREYYDNSQLNSSGFFTLAANQIYLTDFSPSENFSIDELGTGITTAVAGSTFKCCIYDSDADGVPRSLLLVTHPISSAANGYFKDTVSFTFQEGIQYWIGIYSTHAIGIRGVAASACETMGLTFNNSNVYFTHYQIARTFGLAPPNPSGVTKANRASGAKPSIRFYSL